MRRVIPARRRLDLSTCFRRGAGIALAALVFLASPGHGQTAPVPGQNINMVSGTQFPGGDPFLQRQNEPSLAVSSRNALHLLAGANDYRTVDLPVSDSVPGSLAGDAWLGVFKSFDGAQSWQSTLLPGFPQDQSAEGLASPLKAYNAAADPTVRAGTSGLFYYSGIAFNRGTNNGAVFVARYLDANQKENGDATAGKDTMKYVSTVVVDTGTSGQFIDKPWIAVDIPARGRRDVHVQPLRHAAELPGRQRLPGLEPLHREHEHEDHVLALARLREDLVDSHEALGVELDQPGDEHGDRPVLGRGLRHLAPVRDVQPVGRDPDREVDGFRKDLRVQEHQGDRHDRPLRPGDDDDAVPDERPAHDRRLGRPRLRRVGTAERIDRRLADRHVDVVGRGDLERCRCRSSPRRSRTISAARSRGAISSCPS